MSGQRPDRRGAASAGIALLVALIALLTLALMATGLLGVAAARARAAAARQDLLVVRAAAAADVARVAATWDDWASLPIGADTAVLRATDPAGLTREVRVRRLSPDRAAVRARAVLAPGGVARGRASAGLLLLLADPLLLWSRQTAALTAAADVLVADGGVVDGRLDLACGPAIEADLLAFTGAAAAAGVRRVADARLDAVGGAVAGSPPVETDSAPRPGLPEVLLHAASIHADHHVAGALTPAPPPPGAGCPAGSPENWGAPGDPAHPCRSFLPLIHAAGDLLVDGGVGQGTLLVRGRLTFRAGATFHGPVFAGAGVDLAPGTSIRGAVHAAGGPPTEVRGRIEYDACAVRRALSAASALRRPLRPGSRFWIPTP